MTSGSAPLIDPAPVMRLLEDTAAAVILPRFRALAPDEVRDKRPGDPVTVADLESERLITEGLRALAPEAVVIGEEAVSSDPALLSRLHDDGLAWTLDPIDGTINFVKGRAAFVVMVGLAEAGVVRQGWIYDPVHGGRLEVVVGGGVRLDGRPPALEAARAPADAIGAAYGRIDGRGDVAKLLVASGRIATLDRTWSGGVDYLRLARGELDFFLSTGSLPWDHVPGVALAAELGWPARFLDAAPYDLRRRDGGPLLVARSEEIWQTVRDVVVG